MLWSSTRTRPVPKRTRTHTLGLPAFPVPQGVGSSSTRLVALAIPHTGSVQSLAQVLRDHLLREGRLRMEVGALRSMCRNLKSPDTWAAG